MSALTKTAGYPVHRVVEFSRWTNPHQVSFTDWTAACGVTGYLAGWMSTFGKAGDARRLELCTSCFPGRRRDGHFPDPVEVPSQKGTG
jgi:hypothetical protein